MTIGCITTSGTLQRHPPSPPSDGHDFLRPILVGDIAHAALLLGIGTQEPSVTGIIQHPEPCTPRAVTAQSAVRELSETQHSRNRQLLEKT